MRLLYFANQLGRYISKFSFGESEYLRAIIVSGQKNLKIIKMMPSKTINAYPIQSQMSTLSIITAYSI
jgi:hypothetical protein